MFYRDVIEIQTNPGNPQDITERIQGVLDKCEIKDGVCNLFLTGTTAGLFINENDRMLIEDFRRMLDEIAHPDRIYHHQKNAHAHLRASLLGQHVTMPIYNGHLIIGTWQRVFLWEFDGEPRTRKVVLTVSY